MKHVVVVVTAICAVMIGAPAANASQHAVFGLRSARTVHLYRASSAAQLRHAFLARAQRLPHAQSGAPAKLDATAFHLDEGTFPPAKVDKTKDEGVLDNATADKTFFRQFHSKNYEDLKRDTGYYEQGFWQPGSAADTIRFAYAASTFADTATAQAAMADAQATLKSFNQLDKTDCSASGVTCYALVTGGKTTDNKNLLVAGYVLQYNQCLAETEADGLDTLLNSNADQVVKTLQAVTGAAASTLLNACGTSAPAALQFSVVKVQFQKATQNPKPSDPVLKKAKAGATVSLIGVLAVTAGPASVDATVSYVIKRNGKTVLKDSQSGSIQPDPNNDIAVLFSVKLKKQTGTYKATMTFKLADQTQKGTASLKVVKK